MEHASSLDTWSHRPSVPKMIHHFVCSSLGSEHNFCCTDNSFPCPLHVLRRMAWNSSRLTYVTYSTKYATRVKIIQSLPPGHTPRWACPCVSSSGNHPRCVSSSVQADSNRRSRTR